MNITISVPQEIEVKLKKVENKSGLITSLLEKHFNKEEDPKILKIKRDKLIKELESNIKEIDYEIEIREKEKENIEELEQKKAEKRESLIKGCINTARDVFNRRLTEKQAEEYINGDYKDLKEYLKIKDDDNTKK